MDDTLTMMMKLLSVIVLLTVTLEDASAFTTSRFSVGGRRLFETTEEGSAEEKEGATTASSSNKVEAFLQKKFPSFHAMVGEGALLRSLVNGDDKAATIFAPNDAAFDALGEKKRSQIRDPRNEEIRERMVGFHVVPEASISAMELRTEDWTKGRPKDGSKPDTIIAAVTTQAGEVPVGREKTGGVLGWGAKATGDIIVGPEAKILQSYNVGNVTVHEMDALVSPLVLWRYCDQLRIDKVIDFE